MSSLSGRRRAGLAVSVAGALLGAWWLSRKLRSQAGCLTGQVAVVTGGSRGLGLLIADELAKEGCRLVICARNAGELAEAARALRFRGAEVLTVTCDVSDRSQVEGLVRQTIAAFGRVDILVNNAGIIMVAALEALDPGDFHQVMAINFWGTFNTTLAALPHMRAQRSGRIVNITSIGGKVAVPHLLPYDCAKFATVGFSEGLRAEVAAQGVSVTTVVPGLMRTGSDDFAHFKGKADEEHRWFRVAARLPGLAMSSRRAARRIVEATKRRDAELVLGLPAKLLRLINALFPALTLRTLAVVNRLLPSAE
jgi:short-subunit dehydrogenase